METAHHLSFDQIIGLDNTTWSCYPMPAAGEITLLYTQQSCNQLANTYYLFK
jgi:hypothetical protein